MNKPTIEILRQRFNKLYHGIKKDERKHIVIYFDKLARNSRMMYEPYALPVIWIEIMNRTKLGRDMLRHLNGIGLI